MARTTGRSRRRGKVDLRVAYERSGYSGDYAWFVRTKVVPLIGEASLHRLPCQAGSRVREYSVTANNFKRVVRSLGITNESVRRVRNVVDKLSKDQVSALVVKLLEKTIQPTPSKDYPAAFRIPIHPISHNEQYASAGRRVRSTDYHRRFKTNFANAIAGLKPDLSKVDFTKPVDIHLHYGHRRSGSCESNYFDNQNFDKAAYDELYRYVGLSDHQIAARSCTREFVEDYSDGFIEYRIRNCKELNQPK